MADSAHQRLERNESDEFLLERVVARDQEAFLALYLRYKNRVFSLILTILKDRPLSEEVLQDLFQKLWDRPEMYQSAKGHLLSWLLTVARNISLDYKRKESRRARYYVVPDEDFEVNAIAACPTLDPESLQSIQKLLATLPAEQKKALDLAYFEGLTHPEMAAETGESLGTMKTRIRLGLQKLRTALRAGMVMLLAL
jgi:RNA polymerase sigma-70 factor, ECF subfamily